MNDALTFRVEFLTDKFKYMGEVDPKSNAGNQLYGQDVAEWIEKEFRLSNTVIIDEDWGWLVEGTLDEASVVFGVANWNDREDKSESTGHWYVIVDYFLKRKILGIFNSSKQTDVPKSLSDMVLKKIEQIGGEIVTINDEDIGDQELPKEEDA